MQPRSTGKQILGRRCSRYHHLQLLLEERPQLCRRQPSLRRAWRIVKYTKTTQISTDLVTKHSLSAADKNCDNLVHLDEALKASDVLTLANGSRPLPMPTPLNPSGYSPTIQATFDEKPMYIVIDEDDIFRYNAENKVCMLLIQRILNKDMLHHLQPSIDANNASHTYLKILDFFKGHKHHYIESARVALNNFRFATDV